MAATPPYSPGAGAEQLVKAKVQAVAAVAATSGAQYCTLRKNVTARRFTGDVKNPMAQAAGGQANPAAVALADAVANAASLGVLPGPRPTWSGA